MKNIIIESDQYWRRQILGVLESLGQSYHLATLKGLKNNSTFASKYWLICTGGDGRLNKAINFIMKNNLQDKVLLSYFPTGTANDFSKSTGLSKLTLQQCLNLQEKNIQEISVGQVNHRYFINCASLSSMTAATSFVSPKLKQRIGKWAYYLNYICSALRLKSFYATISDSSGHIIRDKFIGLILANGAFVGGGLRVSKAASVTHGTLQLVSFKKSLRHIRQAAAFSEIEIKLDKVVPMNLDGVAYYSDRFNVKVHKNSLRMFLPC